MMEVTHHAEALWPGSSLAPALVALDTETGGLQTDKVALLEVGLAWRDPDGEIETRRLTIIPEPGLRIETQAMEVNGWYGVPVGAIPEALALQLLSDLDLTQLLVAHSATYDSAIMKAASRRQGTTIPGRHWQCTMHGYANTVSSMRRRYSLDDVCGVYDITRAKKLGGRHDAAMDAAACLQVAERLWPDLKGVWQ